MGLISFVKNAGEKLIVKRDNEEVKQQAVNDQELEAEARKALRIENLIKDLGFDVNDLFVTVDDDKVTLEGKVANLETKEKVVLAAGNVDGIANVDDNLQVVANDNVHNVSNTGTVGEAGSTYYTVESGDSLSKIAKHFYGDASRYNSIFEANRPMLNDPDKIYPGQVLRIPNAQNA